MDPKAVAIRLPEIIKAGPKELVGKQPIVVFAEQGGTGAANDEDQLAPVGADLKADGALGDLQAPPADFRKKYGGQPAPQFELSEIIFVIDRSSSMGAKAIPSARTTKLRHIKDEITKMAEGTLAGTPVSLVAFDYDAKQVEITDNKSGEELTKAVESIRQGSGTNFASALDVVKGLVSSNPGKERKDRKLLVFITDGDDFQERERALELAAEVRDANVGTLIIGTGVQYNPSRIVELAQKFAYSGWIHTPMDPLPDGTPINAFSFLLGAMIEQVQTAEHYMRISADTEGENSFGLTPSARRTEDGTYHIGYFNEAKGIYFVEPGTTPSLTLELARDAADKDPVKRDIRVIDFEDAAFLHEQREDARRCVAPFLVAQAQLKMNVGILFDLKEAYPHLGEQIDLIMQGAKGGDGDRNTAMSLGSSMHSMDGLTQLGWEHANHLSRVMEGGELPDKADVPSALPADFTASIRKPGAKGRRAEPKPPAGLHSGVLGPLDASFGSLPDFDGQGDAKAYDGAIPVNHPRISYKVNGSTRGQRDLQEISRKGIIVGRGFLANLKLSSKRVSWLHARITKEGDGFVVRDLKSKNGVRVNGEKIDEVKFLSDGDKIQIADCEITFHSGK